jgi:hypothetical protein
MLFELFSGISSHPTVFFSHSKSVNSTFNHNKLAISTTINQQNEQADDTNKTNRLMIGGC